MFVGRSLVFTHEALREWEARLAPLLSETLRKHRRGRIGCSWYVDETFIKVKGRLAYPMSADRGARRSLPPCNSEMSPGC
jgi:transposase-like protein